MCVFFSFAGTQCLHLHSVSSFSSSLLLSIAWHGNKRQVFCHFSVLEVRRALCGPSPELNHSQFKRMHSNTNTIVSAPVPYRHIAISPTYARVCIMSYFFSSPFRLELGMEKICTRREYGIWKYLYKKFKTLVLRRRLAAFALRAARGAHFSIEYENSHLTHGQRVCPN